MANMTSLKRQFLKKNSDGFRSNFQGTCQIDVRKGTESLAALRAAVFEISQKFARGGKIYPPPAPRGLNSIVGDSNQARTQDFAQEGATCFRRGPKVTRGSPGRPGYQGPLGDQGPRKPGALG